jgi:hypothetical protein
MHPISFSAGVFIRNHKLVNYVQIIDTFVDSVMSVCLTKTEIIGGSIDGNVRTFDMRIGRFVTSRHIFFIVHEFNTSAVKIKYHVHCEFY